MGTLDTLHYEGNLLDKIAELERRLNALERTELSGVVGPQGPTGATGAQGPDGAGSPAGAVQGDIVYYNATPEAAALNIGTAEQVLRTNAGATAPEWAAIDNDSIANRTRTLFVPATECENVTDGTYENRIYRGWEMQDAKDCQCYAAFRAPSDYVSTATLQAIFDPAGTGNAYIYMAAYYGNIGEAFNTHSNNTGWQTEAVVNTINDQFSSALSLVSLDASDYVVCRFERDGVHANDTISAILYFKGFLLSYTADM